jgi:hypothetical protein
MYPLSLMSGRGRTIVGVGKGVVELGEVVPAAGTGTGIGEEVKAPPRVGRRREIMSTYGGGGSESASIPASALCDKWDGGGADASGSVFNPPSPETGVLSSSTSASAPAGMLVLPPPSSGYDDSIGNGVANRPAKSP